MVTAAMRDLATGHAANIYFPHRPTPQCRAGRAGSRPVPGAGADMTATANTATATTIRSTTTHDDSCPLVTDAATSKQTAAAAAYQRHWIKEEVGSQGTAFRHARFLAFTFMLEMTPIPLAAMAVRSNHPHSLRPPSSPPPSCIA